jgi:hypothetical protein
VVKKARWHGGPRILKSGQKCFFSALEFFFNILGIVKGKDPAAFPRIQRSLDDISTCEGLANTTLCKVPF